MNYLRPGHWNEKAGKNLTLWRCSKDALQWRSSSDRSLAMAGTNIRARSKSIRGSTLEQLNWSRQTSPSPKPASQSSGLLKTNVIGKPKKQNNNFKQQAYYAHDNIYVCFLESFLHIDFGTHFESLTPKSRACLPCKISGPSLEDEATRKIERALHRMEENAALQNEVLEKKLGDVTGMIEEIFELLQNGSPNLSQHFFPFFSCRNWRIAMGRH